MTELRTAGEERRGERQWTSQQPPGDEQKISEGQEERFMKTLDSPVFLSTPIIPAIRSRKHAGHVPDGAIAALPGCLRSPGRHPRTPFVAIPRVIGESGSMSGY